MTTDKKTFEERIKKYPMLKDRFESLLNVVENASGDVEKADEAEKQVIKTLKDMGQEAIESWASNRETLLGDEAEKKFGSPHEKKTLLAYNLRDSRSKRTYL